MAGWAEQRNQAPGEVTGTAGWANQRETMDDSEQESPSDTSVLDVVKATPQAVRDTIDSVVEFNKDVSTEVVRSTAAGLYKAGGDMSALGAAGLETLYDTGRIIGREGYKAVTDEYPSDKPFELTNYFSDKFKETTKRDVKALAGDNQGVLGQYTQKIAEYAGLTQAVLRQVLTKGAAMNAVPTAISQGKIKSTIEKSMMAAAKDPKSAIKVEQTISALMASAGETAKQLGVGEGGQVATELATGLMSGQIINTTKSMINFVSKKFPDSADKAGKIQAAEYLQSVFSKDPEIAKKLERGLELQKETGVKMNLAELTNNPELKDAFQTMEVHTVGSMTELEARLAQQTKQIKESFPTQPDYKQSAVKGVDDMQSETEIVLDNMATKAVDNVLDQIDNAAPLDRNQLGESGRIALNTSREAMEVEVNQLYKEVGNPNIPTKVIVKAVQEAKKSPLANDAYMKELDADLVSTLEANVLGNKQQGKVLDAPVKKIYLGRGEGKLPTEMSLDSMRLIESRLKEKIRIANANGKGNEARILSKILNGVFEQYKTVTGAEAHQIANLKKAASASKRLHNIFDQGEVLMQSRINAKGFERITTEGFVRNFVKPNSDTKLARTDEAVDGFYDAYGDMPEAKQWMTNAFGSLLKEEIQKQGGKIEPKAIKRFIGRHSNFLKRARIGEKFDSISKAVDEANTAEMVKDLNYKDYQKTIMSKFAGSDDPISYVMNAMQKGTLPALQKEVSAIKNKARREIVERGIKEALWEGVQRKLTTTDVVSGTEIMLNTGAVRKMLDSKNYGKQLEEGLGKEHFNSLNKLIDIVDRISPATTRTAGLPKERVDDKIVEKLMTGLRAAAHGFVRPDLIAAQMAMRGYKAITTAQSQKILKEAMNNPEFAKELIKMSTSLNGKSIVGTMFSPLIAPIISDKETGE